jgi:Acetyl-CoA carboxylase, carboxyltransferase component (subunits alpha and beta)
MLLDENSFIEIDSFVTHRSTDNGMFLHHTLGDGVVAGHGTVNGRRIYCFAQDFSVHGGSMGEMHAKKISKIIEMAERAKVPIICMWDGGGQRAHDGISALAGTGELLDRLVQCSGRIPMISLVLGPVVGVSALAASLADFTILGEDHGQLFLSSPLETPEVIEGEIDAAGLGGASLHASRSGIACLIAEDEEDACTLATEILSYLPDHNMADAPFEETADPANRLNPDLETFVPDTQTSHTTWSKWLKKL